jgi:hypothetical protein
MPPAGDVPHTYAFYLYRQPSANFTLPSRVNYTDLRTTNRINYNLTALTAAVGNAPIAANYFLVQNTNSSATAPAANRTTAAPTTSSTAASTARPTNASTTPAVTPARGAAAANGVAAGVFALVGVAGAVLLL